MVTKRKTVSLQLLRLGLLTGVLGCTASSEPREGIGERRRLPEPNVKQGGAATVGGAGDSSPAPESGQGSADSDGATSVAGAAPEAGGTGAAGAAGADQSTPEGEGGSAGMPCTESLLGRALVEHACLHAEQGPFVDLTAAPDEASAPAVNAAHTAYRAGSSGGALSWLRFTAAGSGAYAFLGVLPTSLVFTRADGSLVHSTATVTSCAGLPAARVLELDAKQPLSLSWAEGDLVLVVEALAPFGEQAWEQGCECAELGSACAVETSCCSGLCVDARCVAPVCRSSGPCVSDVECCVFCHDQDHCH
jgi:hypothetical protein